MTLDRSTPFRPLLLDEQRIGAMAELDIHEAEPLAGPADASLQTRQASRAAAVGRAIRRHAPLTAILAAALAVRLVVHQRLPYLVFPDEIFQTLEPAHRLVFGTGIVPWEYVVGIRSWLLPGIAAGLMAIGSRFGSNPETILWPVTIFMALGSLAPVICGYLWGYRFGGRPGAIASGTVTAVWVELIYFSTHTLTEVVAGDALVVALYLGYPGIRVTSRRRLFWSGVAFGVVFAFRFHLAPAIAVAAVAICGLDFRHRWLPLAAGALIPTALAGALDWATWSYPFQSIWLNFWLNVVDHVSQGFGVSPWYMLAKDEVTFWGGATALIVLCAIWGGRRLPVLLAVILAIFLVHSAFAHKEYRFVYPALPLLTALAGVATAEAIAALRRLGWPTVPITAAAMSFWLVTSLAIAVTPSYRALWTRSSAALAAFRAASRDPSLCGAALYDIPWWWTPGQTGLPPHVPLYTATGSDIARTAGSFTTAFAFAGSTLPDRRFEQHGCFADGRDDWLNPQPAVCVWQRAGGCAPSSARVPGVNWPDGLRRDGARGD
jgi:hypothetical protein